MTAAYLQNKIVSKSIKKTRSGISSPEESRLPWQRYRIQDPAFSNGKDLG